MSPCGLEVAMAYSTNDVAFTSEDGEVDCPVCLSTMGVGIPTPEPAKDEHDEYLQVFMTHDVVISEFKRMLAMNGWHLSQIPRDEDETDDTYVRTHIITPNPNVFGRKLQ